MNFVFKLYSCEGVELSLMIVMVMMVRLVVSADVYHQPGGVVSHHVQELSLELELVDLVLPVPPGQHVDHSVHLPHPGRHVPLRPLGARQRELVCLKEGRDPETLPAIYSGEVCRVAEGLSYAERNQGVIEIEN